MPFARVDMLEGRSPDEIKALLEATQRTVVAAFKVPQRDRYQVVHEHPASHFIVEDTGLGIAPDAQLRFLPCHDQGRDREAKEKFYNLLCRELEATCGIAPSDVVVTMVTNTDEDWSFGNGRAQFLTGELASGRKVPSESSSD